MPAAITRSRMALSCSRLAFQSMGWCLSVDGVDHYLLRLDLLHHLQPGTHIFLTSIVDALSVACPSHEHRLDDKVSMESLHAFDDLVNIIGTVGVIHLINI